MLKRLAYLLALSLTIVVVACGKYDFVPHLYFEVEATPNSGSIASGNTQTLRLYNFNTNQVDKIDIGMIKLGSAELIDYRVVKNGTEIEIDYRIPESVGNFSEVSVIAEAPERGENIVTVKF
ncbi:MAG: hypothetical protein MUE85_19510 [Microscillaceae bacterium]|jgi:hypothetical protein|nr:hypothetical protein [Microscillaceae bacterium]